MIVSKAVGVTKLGPQQTPSQAGEGASLHSPDMKLSLTNGATIPVYRAGGACVLVPQ